MNSTCFREPNGKWSLVDYAGLAILVAAASILYFSGLSLKSLWGSEGRWAVIAREMMQNGNYFLPTINGRVYFDKPLLSYWAIIPFSWFTGVTEISARLPGALAGVGTVALTFVTGRRMFGFATGLLSGAVLLTTPMFGFWSRTASAELLNVLAIWLMLSVLAGRGREPVFGRYLLFYVIAAVSSFCKGPVAPAVALLTMVALSSTETVVEIRHKGFDKGRQVIIDQFDWILSLKGSLAALSGVAVFALLLFLPVIVTGSWDAVELMWRENVTRFFKPFDHVEPFYSYLKHIPIFLTPWTFIAAASLIHMRKWEPGWSRRWTVCVLITIFMFFTISGSRRSYYILPIIPVFALIVGRSLAGFLDRTQGDDRSSMKAALLVTGCIVFLAGIVMPVGYFKFEQYRHISEIILGPVIAAAGGLSVLLIYKRRFFQGTAILVFALYCVLLWGYTAGAVIGERPRTLKPFAGQLKKYLDTIDGERMAMYGVGNSSLIFYLGMSKPIRTLDELNDVCAYVKKPENYLLTEEVLADRILGQCGPVNLVRILIQTNEGKKRDREGLVLLRTGEGA